MGQRLAFATLFLVCPFCVAGNSLRAAESRPNVVFFLSDDQRADFLGCAGHPIVKTPTIDSLAGRGVRFENAFVTVLATMRARCDELRDHYGGEYTHEKFPNVQRLQKQRSQERKAKS